MKTRIDWNFYLNRRKTTLKSFIRSGNIKSYSQLCEVMDGLKVSRPPEEEVSGLFSVPEKEPEKKSVKKTKPRKTKKKAKES